MVDPNELVKSDAVGKLADLINKLAGPMAEEAGAMLGDKVRVYRVRNWINTVRKTERLLQNAGLPANAIPPRLFLPIMEGSSVEDNEDLQDMWAGLLASASQDTDKISPSFTETLKQLAPHEARLLQKLYDGTRPAQSGGIAGEIFVNSLDPTTETFERLGILRKSYGLMNVPSMRDVGEPAAGPFHEPEIGHRYGFTRYAIAFVQACQGPKNKEQKTPQR